MKYSFFFRLNIQHQNLGDLLINRELIRLAAEVGRVYVDTAQCPPHVWKEICALRASNISQINGLYSMMKAVAKERFSGRRCVYLLTPGGNAGASSFRSVGSEIKSLLQIYGIAMTGIRLIHLGVSYERLGSIRTRFIRLRALVLAAHYVRDARSFALLKGSGIRVSGIMPDLAFNLFAEDRAPRLHAEDNGERRTRKRVVLSFRCDQREDQLDRVKNFLVRAFEELPPDTEYTVYSQVRYDDQTARDLFLWMKKIGLVTTYLRIVEDGISAATNTFRNSDIVLSNRLHVLLLGGAAGCVMIPCVEDVNEKIVGVFENIREEFRIVRIDNLPTKDILSEALQNPVELPAARLELNSLMEVVLRPS